MPTFFESMKRLFSGKPVYTPQDFPGQHQPMQPASAPSQDVQAPQQRIRKNDASSFPVVYVKKWKTHLRDGRIEVACYIENTWPEQIMLDKIRLLGTTHELDTYLRPHEEREFIVYKGPALRRQGDPQAQIDYKTTHEGDYFESVHDVTYRYLPDQTYDIANIRLHPPIRDIYG